MLGRIVPGEGTCLQTVDPATMLPTGDYVEDGLPSDDILRLIEIELAEPDINKWVALRNARTTAAGLAETTRGELDRSSRQREVRRPGGFAYQVTVTPGGKVYDVDGATTALTLAGLNLGIDYRFDVRAVNAAGAGAPTTAALVGAKLSISSRTITYGSSTSVTGDLKKTTGAGLRATTVSLDGRKKGSTTWIRLATRSTDESGRYSFVVKPFANCEYRTIYRGDSSHVGTMSAVGVVTVRQKVTGQWSDNTIRRGQTVKFYGSVSPNHRGQVIYLQRYVGGAWHTSPPIRLSSTSTYAFSRTIYKAGIYKYRTYRPGDADHAGGFSPTRTLYVS